MHFFTLSVGPCALLADSIVLLVPVFFIRMSCYSLFLIGAFSFERGLGPFFRWLLPITSAFGFFTWDSPPPFFWVFDIWPIPLSLDFTFSAWLSGPFLLFVSAFIFLLFCSVHHSCFLRPPHVVVLDSRFALEAWRFFFRLGWALFCSHLCFHEFRIRFFFQVVGLYPSPCSFVRAHFFWSTVFSKPAFGQAQQFFFFQPY